MVDNATDEDGKEFYTITTADESVFYLVIDKQKTSENVYFLNTVTVSYTHLWGGVGTGKSYLAACIANALMEKEVAVCMTNFATILNDLAASFEGRNEYICLLYTSRCV